MGQIFDLYCYCAFNSARFPLVSSRSLPIHLAVL